MHTFPPGAAGVRFWRGLVQHRRLGQLDADGFLSIVGRKKEVINFSGMKIFPQMWKLCSTSTRL